MAQRTRLESKPFTPEDNMATKAAIQKYLDQFPRWRKQPEGFMDYIARAGKDITDHPTGLRVFTEQMLRENRLCENQEYRAAFNEFWSNALEDHWGYRSEAAEGFLTNAITSAGYPAVTVELIEYYWPEIKPKLSPSEDFRAHQRKLAQDAKDAADRPVLTAQLLQHFKENLQAEIRRTGDVQKNIPAHMERETTRLSQLTVDQLRNDVAGLSVDNTAVSVKNARLIGLGVTELRKEVSKQTTPAAYNAPTQAYGNNGHKRLPPTYNGKPWTTKLIYNMTPREQSEVMRLYGGSNIDKACAANRAKGIR